ncbi:MAG TPA: hypothetical protein VMT99_00460 [Candidatus Paceibacterota bacterium]|nr:hypothetical protein [Candidatus Paceibacterota bacterium]
MSPKASKNPKERNEAAASESGTQDFKKKLKEIAGILEWFDSQEELDVEQALEKVKLASELIKTSKKRLGELENQFREIKADLGED